MTRHLFMILLSGSLGLLSGCDSKERKSVDLGQQKRSEPRPSNSPDRNTGSGTSSGTGTGRDWSNRDDSLGTDGDNDNDRNLDRDGETVTGSQRPPNTLGGGGPTRPGTTTGPTRPGATTGPTQPGTTTGPKQQNPLPTNPGGPTQPKPPADTGSTKVAKLPGTLRISKNAADELVVVPNFDTQSIELIYMKSAEPKNIAPTGRYRLDRAGTEVDIKVVHDGTSSTSPSPCQARVALTDLKETPKEVPCGR